MTNFVRLGSVVSASEQRVVLSSLRNARSTGSHTMAYCGVTVSVFELRKLLEKMRPRCLWNRRKLLALAEFRRCLRQLGLEFRPDILHLSEGGCWMKQSFNSRILCNKSVSLPILFFVERAGCASLWESPIPIAMTASSRIGFWGNSQTRQADESVRLYTSRSLVCTVVVLSVVLFSVCVHAALL